MSNRELKDNEIKFMRGLEQLTRETGIIIGGCGDCGSPWLTKLTDEERDARAGYGFQMNGTNHVSWISPSDEYDWEEYRDSIVK